jgi:hypothetical protein
MWALFFIFIIFISIFGGIFYYRYKLKQDCINNGGVYTDVLKPSPFDIGPNIFGRRVYAYKDCVMPSNKN